MEIAYFICQTPGKTSFYADEPKLRGMYGHKSKVLSYGGGNWVDFNFLMVF